MNQTYGERVIWRMHRHWLVPVTNLVFSAPLMLIAMVVVLGFADQAGQQGWPISLLLGSAVAGTWFAAPMIAWNSTSLTLTTHRVVIERGILGQVHIAVPYDRIQAVDIRQGLAGRIFGYGTVDLGVATSNGPVSLEHVPLRGLREHLVLRVTNAGSAASAKKDRRAV